MTRGTWNSKLTDDQRDELVRRYEAGESSVTALAATYGITPGGVSQLLTRRLGKAVRYATAAPLPVGERTLALLERQAVAQEAAARMLGGIERALWAVYSRLLPEGVLISEALDDLTDVLDNAALLFGERPAPSGAAADAGGRDGQ